MLKINRKKQSKICFEEDFYVINFFKNYFFIHSRFNSYAFYGKT